MSDPNGLPLSRSSAVQELREHVTLPSDLLRMAQQNNPQLTISFEGNGGPLVLRVVSARGTLNYERGDRERWVDVFRRAGFLARP